MTDEKERLQAGQADAAADDSSGATGPPTHIAPSPHVRDRSRFTRGMMLDVLIALAPLMVVSLLVFRQYAIYVTVLCVCGCMATEAVFTFLRRKPLSVLDCSAVVTGVILAMSLPWNCPWYVAVIAAAAAVALGKMIFGGLGQNLFNPAMVGRAFVMICFASSMSASAYVDKEGKLDKAWLTGATPMSAVKTAEGAEGSEQAEQSAPAGATLFNLFIGKVNGSLGETSALACLIGGAYLVLRRTAAWQIPLGVILSVVVIAGIAQLAGAEVGLLYHLFGGALLFGAFYIATDPTSSPLTPVGRLIFGLGVGGLVMLLRLASSYPEGVMFAVLLMNAVVPLINRWTIPTPVGGPVPKQGEGR